MTIINQIVKQKKIGLQPHDVRLHKLFITHYAQTTNLILILLNT